MVGEARYYFGLPVTEGSVKGGDPVPDYPRWWSFYFGNIHHQPEETIATGTSKLDDAGQFKVALRRKQTLACRRVRDAPALSLRDQRGGHR